MTLVWSSRISCCDASSFPCSSVTTLFRLNTSLQDSSFSLIADVNKPCVLFNSCWSTKTSFWSFWLSFAELYPFSSLVTPLCSRSNRASCKPRWAVNSSLSLFLSFSMYSWTLSSNCLRILSAEFTSISNFKTLFLASCISPWTVSNCTTEWRWSSFNGVNSFCSAMRSCSISFFLATTTLYFDSHFETLSRAAYKLSCSSPSFATYSRLLASKSTIFLFCILISLSRFETFSCKTELALSSASRRDKNLFRASRLLHCSASPPFSVSTLYSFFLRASVSISSLAYLPWSSLVSASFLMASVLSRSMLASRSAMCSSAVTLLSWCTNELFFHSSTFPQSDSVSLFCSITWCSSDAIFDKADWCSSFTRSLSWACFWIRVSYSVLDASRVKISCCKRSFSTFILSHSSRDAAKVCFKLWMLSSK